MKRHIKTLLSVSLTPIILCLSYLLYLRMEKLDSLPSELLLYTPYVIFIAGASISCWFNRSKIFFTFVILALSQLSLTAASDNQFQWYAIYVHAALLIPVNIAIFSFIKERGILTTWGLTRISFISIQVIWLVWIIQAGDIRLVDRISQTVIIPFIRNLSPLPQISLFTLSMALIVLIIRYILGKSPLDIAFSGVLASIAIVFHNPDKALLLPVFFSGSGIMLIAAIIQDSYSMAYLDELTGLPSRRALKQSLLKLGGKYVIAMLDIDFFKKFNDKYGHDVGDDVLRLVASIIRDVTGGGKAFRYGGEEFTVLFPGKRLEDAIPHLEELREAVEKRGFAIRGKDRPGKKPSKPKASNSQAKRVSITISIGTAEKSEKYKTFDDVIKAADKALYRAKRKGRNCVCK